MYIIIHTHAPYGHLFRVKERDGGGTVRTVGRWWLPVLLSHKSWRPQSIYTEPVHCRRRQQ